ncbi:MAG: hypothetical protein LBP33_04505, partial [Candidatus Adiutrix sp.]|nr:hypothetical protein [Candidatus Adiutrix sp.]
MVGKFKISTGRILSEPAPPPETPARPGYGFEETRRFLSERFQAAAESVRSLPAGACPDGYLVVEMVRHPDRLDKREFPGHFLQYLGLTLLG